MSILVTGSAGHLGEALVRTFRGSGRSVQGLDVLRSPFTDLLGSITDRDFVRRSMCGVRTVLHAAALHKPHVATNTDREFVETNVTGTLLLLEAAVAARVESFIFTSTTSAFGSALAAAAGEPAAWITEDVAPIPKNIYGATKLAAETLCELFHRQHNLPILILRTSRFFPEDDDDPTIRDAYQRPNAQANEMLYRRVDIEDVVSAHERAIARAPAIGFGRYVVSATTPFSPGDLAALRKDAPRVVERLFPDFPPLFAARGWKMFPQIDRVYVNQSVREALDWRPKYGFGHVVESLRAEQDFRSSLARQIGSKGYHATAFANERAPFPTSRFAKRAAPGT